MKTTTFLTIGAVASEETLTSFWSARASRVGVRQSEEEDELHRTAVTGAFKGTTSGCICHFVQLSLLKMSKKKAQNLSLLDGSHGI